MSMHSIRKLWESVTEPRHIKATYACVYLLVLTTGIATLLGPPRSIEGQLGTVLTVLWSVFLVVGGTVGAVTVLPGWWWAERMGIILTSTGIGIYGLVVLTLHLTQEGSRLTQLGMILLAWSVLVVRWVLIRHYSFEPRTEPVTTRKG
jgi:hypothetical protein